MSEDESKKKKKPGDDLKFSSERVRTLWNELMGLFNSSTETVLVPLPKAMMEWVGFAARRLGNEYYRSVTQPEIEFIKASVALNSARGVAMQEAIIEADPGLKELRERLESTVKEWAKEKKKRDERELFARTEQKAAELEAEGKTRSARILRRVLKVREQINAGHQVTPEQLKGLCSDECDECPDKATCPLMNLIKVVELATPSGDRIPPIPTDRPEAN